MLSDSRSNSRLTSDLWGWGCGEGRERRTEERKVLLQITPSFRLLIFVKYAIREAGALMLTFTLRLISTSCYGNHFTLSSSGKRLVKDVDTVWC